MTLSVMDRAGTLNGPVKRKVGPWFAGRLSRQFQGWNGGTNALL
jgi:hypothetical protein